MKERSKFLLWEINVEEAVTALHQEVCVGGKEERLIDNLQSVLSVSQQRLISKNCSKHLLEKSRQFIHKHACLSTNEGELMNCGACKFRLLIMSSV